MGSKACTSCVQLPSTFLLPFPYLSSAPRCGIKSISKPRQTRFNKGNGLPQLDSSTEAALRRKAYTTPLRTGALGIKKGMSVMYDTGTGKRHACTIIQMDRVQVVAHKRKEKHGYFAVQVGLGWKHPSNVTRPMLGHFAEHGISPKRYLVEFRVRDENGLLGIGEQIGPDWFQEGQFVDARANSRGMGFAGGMKRHGFKGQPASHGVSLTHRSMGSAGQSQGGGSRVLPGKKMPGRMGGQQVTTQNVKIMRVDGEKGIVVLNGLFTSGPPQTVLPVTTVAAPETSTVAATSIFISIASQGPTTTIEAGISSAQTTESPPVVNVVTSIATNTESGNTATSAGPQTVIVTSTNTGQRFPSDTVTRTVKPSTSSASKSGSAPLASSAADTSSDGGLSAGGKIAVAVVVPVVAVALIVIAVLFLWRKRKQRKEAEELRRNEVEEYGFNPNNDPTLPVVGGASSNGDDGEMTQTDGAGYRGWGTTSTARKPSTTLSSGNGPIGVARSASDSDNGRYTNGSPTAGTNKSSAGQSDDPLVGSPPNNRPEIDDSETIGALGAVPSNNNGQGMHRGPSNASSAYSGAHRSDTSGEGIISSSAPGQPFYSDGMYYDESMPQHGPYGDGSYGGGQPVIRDVPARRNTRIENPSVIPAQGSAGIAQNF
ncbi:MAG: hypothetical protein Q9217_005468 [Psora testacea]